MRVPGAGSNWISMVARGNMGFIFGRPTSHVLGSPTERTSWLCRNGRQLGCRLVALALTGPTLRLICGDCAVWDWWLSGALFRQILLLAVYDFLRKAGPNWACCNSCAQGCQSARDGRQVALAGNGRFAQFADEFEGRGRTRADGGAMSESIPFVRDWPYCSRDG
jgi:hypothetical protein